MLFDHFHPSFLHIFEKCQSICFCLANTDEINNMKNKRVNRHLKVCSKCWNYHHQLKLINKEITHALKTDIDKKCIPILINKKTIITELVNRFSK